MRGFTTDVESRTTGRFFLKKGHCTFGVASYVEAEADHFVHAENYCMVASMDMGLRKKARAYQFVNRIDPKAPYQA